MSKLVPIDKIEDRILQIRGKRVMLDIDLAGLYGVATKVLNQAVRRNIKRFPDDFMFKLTVHERHKVVTICDRLTNLKFSPYLPHAFTQEGVAMVSSVLKSDRAIAVNIQIMRVFVSLRKVATHYMALRRRIDDIEKKYDTQFGIVFEAIKRLLEPPPELPKRRIGFHP